MSPAMSPPTISRARAARPLPTTPMANEPGWTYPGASAYVVMS